MPHRQKAYQNAKQSTLRTHQADANGSIARERGTARASRAACAVAAPTSAHPVSRQSFLSRQASAEKSVVAASGRLGLLLHRLGHGSLNA